MRDKSYEKLPWQGTRMNGYQKDKWRVCQLYAEQIYPLPSELLTNICFELAHSSGEKKGWETGTNGEKLPFSV
ncbi:hypothetical protein [Streptococcus dysgalactiae]|uniref:hypothetical protein n=1 Tax=Streptococcus dysgalactiae TaxID=1334 RepID=UPI001EF2B68A|nr:hypothetical protein [Streptococcus dysgalactiae]